MASLPRAAAFVDDAAGRTGPLTNNSASHSTAPAGNDFLPGPVLLLGAPGVGKGTQAQLLVTKYGIPQISTGDLLRGNIARGTELGLKAKEIMSAGLLVDDETVNQMVLHRLQEKDTHRGYILDGYPRTLDQAKFLDLSLIHIYFNHLWLIGSFFDRLPPVFTNGFGFNFYFGGTSLLIVVGVAMDTVQQVESQLIMRHYDGFSPKSGRIRGRRSW